MGLDSNDSAQFSLQLALSSTRQLLLSVPLIWPRPDLLLLETFNSSPKLDWQVFTPRTILVIFKWNPYQMGPVRVSCACRANLQLQLMTMLVGEDHFWSSSREKGS